MSNLNVPYKPSLTTLEKGEVRIAWTAPARYRYAWNIYADVVGGYPLLNLPLNPAPISARSFRFNYSSVVGNDPPGPAIWVAITSVLEVNGIESAQSPALKVSIGTGDPARPNHVTVGTAPGGQPTYLATDDNGVLIVSTTPAAGVATEAKQDAQISILNSIDGGIPGALGQSPSAGSMPVVLATEQVPLQVLDVVTLQQQLDVALTTVAIDVLQPPTLSPIPTRKMVVLQNNSARDILLGDSAVQGHVIPRNGGVRAFSAGAALSLYARTATGSATLNVWEMG